MRYLPVVVAFLLNISVMQQAYAEISFHNQFSYVDESNVMHILGEIKNDSDTAMKSILIMISFYDNEGNILDNISRAPALRVINPGDSSSFEITYMNQEVDRVANFTISAAGQTTDLKEKQLKIISSNSRLDLLGTYFINAIARNEGQETATNAIMIATLFDKDGMVIALGNALAEAAPGSSNITASSQAPFGIAITEKMQTSKAVKYSLVADSDQYTSNIMILKASSPGTSGGNQTQSGCLIATAAFDSELAPQVQQMRLFRDNIALKTHAGSSFLNVFNTWYYSFSPSVASYERHVPWLQNTIRILIYPLLGILSVSTSIFHSLKFSSEFGILVSGIIASSLIGLFYFAPLGAAIGIAGRKRRWNMLRARFVLSCSWAASLVAIAFAELEGIEILMMVGTSLVVLSAISTSIFALARVVKS